MDYKNIIINGLFDKSTRKNLDLYFLREYKTAKEKHYTLIEFFTGLKLAIDDLIEDYNNQKKEAITILNNDIEFETKNPRSWETEEEAKRSLTNLKRKAETINSEFLFRISNSEYETEIPFKTLEAVSFFIALALDKANNEETAIEETDEPKPSKYTTPQKIKILDQLNIKGWLQDKGLTIYQIEHLLADLFDVTDKSIRNAFKNTIHESTAKEVISEIRSLKAKR